MKSNIEPMPVGMWFLALPLVYTLPSPIPFSSALHSYVASILRVRDCILLSANMQDRRQGPGVLQAPSLSFLFIDSPPPVLPATLKRCSASGEVSRTLLSCARRV